MVTLALMVIFGTLGLAIDMGWAHFRRQAAQAAADSAALAAVSTAIINSPSGIACGSNSVFCQSTAAQCPIPIPTTPANNLHNACLYAKQNGFAATALSGLPQNVQVAANTGNPSITGLTNVTYYATATVTEQLPQTFSMILGHNLTTVTATSTAAYFGGGSGGACIYVLATLGTSFSMTGSATITSGCGLWINSAGGTSVDPNDPAVSVMGNNRIAVPSTNVVGTFTSNTSDFTPLAHQNATAVADPFSGLTAPTPSKTCADASGAIVATASISQGTYCSQIYLTGSSVLTMSPGLYILEQGIKTTGSVTVQCPGGCTIYLSGGSLQMNGGGPSSGTYKDQGINIVAPSSGPYEGIAFWQDKSDTNAATINGSANSIITGVVYMPTAYLDFTGSSNSTETALAVNTLKIEGSTTIGNGAMALAGKGGSSAISLVQ
jgi:hypothetical protein